MDEIIDDDNEEESNEDEDESDEDEDGSDEDEDGSDEDEDGSDEDQAPIEEEMKASREHLVIPKGAAILPFTNLVQVTGLRKSLESTEPIELSDGRLICSPHRLTICGKCCVDYSFMDEILTDDDEEEEESDGDVPLTEEEMKAFRKRMIAKKGAAVIPFLSQPWRPSTNELALGCACFLPFVGSGCKNCDPELKKTKETRID